jgi:hypothetical protein
VRAGLSVKEENILKLTLFFGCVGAKYPLTQTQTHSVFLGVSLSTNALLWPFLHMLQRRTGSLTDSFSKKNMRRLLQKLFR